MNNLQSYYENTQKPWGKLFYEVIWAQLESVKSMNVLDFGSGFGFTANFLARHNNVVAIEPNPEMCEMVLRENPYRQITGGLELLDGFPDNHFDAIVCHNVLEYIEDKETYIKQFARILKNNGSLSLVKHNKPGRIMQRVIFENNLELAQNELKGQSAVAQNFGEVKYYGKAHIEHWIEKYNLQQTNLFGVRAFFGLVQDNKLKYDKLWQKSMLELELTAGCIEEYINIAFFNHVILSKI